MDNVVINFTGDTTGLKPVENVLDEIIQKDKELGDAWQKTSDKMNQTTTQNTDAQKRFAKSMSDIAEAAKTLDKGIVGAAYKQFLKELQDQLGLTNKEVITYIKNSRTSAQQDFFKAGTEEEAKEIAIGIQVLNDMLRDMGALEDETGTKTQSLRARIREAKQELVNMAEAGLSGTAKFEELKKKAGELDDEMRDVNATVKNMGSDTKNLDGLISLASGVAGGFAIMQGAEALFGKQDEETQKVLIKLNAVMSILQGLQTIQNVLQKESAASLLLNTKARVAQTVAVAAETEAEIANTAATEANAAATGAQTVATEGAVVAQESMNASLIASPVAAVILSVMALVVWYQVLTDDTKEVKNAQDKLNQALEAGNEILNGYIAGIDHLTAKQVASAKLRGASELEVSKIEGDAANLKLKQIEAARDAVIQQINDEKTNRKLSVDEYKKLLDLELQLTQKYTDERNALEVKALEFQKQKNDEALRSFIGFQEARVAATIAGSDNERSSQISSIRAIAAEREKSADFIALTDGEKAKQRADDERQIQQLQLQNYQHYLKDRASASEAYTAQVKLDLIKNEVDSIDSINKITDAQIAALKKRRTEAQSDPTLNSGEQLKIVTETNLQIAELEQQKQVKILQIQLAGINAGVIMQQKGTKQRLDLELNAIAKQQQIDLSATELTQNQIDEIKAKHLLAEIAARKAFNDAQIQNDISYINASLENFRLSENDRHELLLKRLDDQRKLEISQADNNQAKIAEINAKYDQQIIDEKKATINAILQEQLRNYDAFTKGQSDYNNKVLQFDRYNYDQKQIANTALLNIEKSRLDQEIQALQKQKDQKLITDKEYNVSYQELLNKKNEAELAAAEKSSEIDRAKNQKMIDATKEIFSQLQKSFDATLGQNATATGLTQIQNLYTTLKDIQNSDITNGEKLRKTVASSVAAGQEIINQLFTDSSAARQQTMNDEISALEDQKSKELSNANLTAQQKADIDKKYKQKEAQVKRDEFIADRDAKKEQAIINGLLAATQTFARLGWPAGIIPAALIEAASIAAALKIGSAPIPKFKKGKVNIEGPGTTTSDSIPAMISKGESVINAKATSKWQKALEAINSDNFENYLEQRFSNFVFPQVPEFEQPITSEGYQIDYDKLGNVIASKIPEATYIQNTMDEKGLHSFVIKGNSKTEYKNKRYSMS